MPTRLIFICHGQLPGEKEKGLKLRNLIDGMPGFRAFFAEAVHSTDGLSQHIFANLEHCDGFLAVMHKRGDVSFHGRTFTRASVWLQQELAIVSFINSLRAQERRIKVRVFAQHGIKREGLVSELILNPIDFENDDDIPLLVQEWLFGPDFAEDPIERTREGLFRKLTSDFTDDHWRYLEVMMALSGGTTNDVAQSHVLTMLKQMGGLEHHDVPDKLKERGFITLGGIDRVRGMEPTALTLAFIDLIREELRRRGTV